MKICFILTVVLGIACQCNGESLNILNVFIKWVNRGQQTDFYITTPYTGSNLWLGVGLNLVPKMNGANVMVCKRLASGESTVQHYLNTFYVPVLLDVFRPSIGISNASVSLVQGNLTCSFTRENSKLNLFYFNMDQANNEAYVLVASGYISTLIDLQYHGNYKAASSSMLSFTPPPNPNSALSEILTTVNDYVISVKQSALNLLNLNFKTTS